MKELGVGKVASVMGRYYAMDRDNRWDRVERAYNALTRGEGGTAVSAAAGIQASYDAEVNDEFVEPFVVVEDGKPVATVKITIPLFSSISVLTVQERSRERSVMTISRDLPETDA